MPKREGVKRRGIVMSGAVDDGVTTSESMGVEVVGTFCRMPISLSISY